jgi:hypothetical protein
VRLAANSTARDLLCGVLTLGLFRVGDDEWDDDKTLSFAYTY